MTPYAALLDRAREIHLLESAASVLAWDQETMLPPGGAELRARQLALLAGLAHARAVAPELGELLSACASLDLEPDAEANVRELRRSHERAARLPASLVEEIAETTSLAQHAWAKARAGAAFAEFRPWLERLLRLMQAKAACLGVPAGGEPWDALADAYEPGMRAADLRPLFADLEPRLVALGDELGRRGRAPAAEFRRLELPIAAQEAFVRFVAERIGFDFTRGRLDRSTHPFCSGSHPGDVRITTRFRADDVIDALGSTMHEAGHGIYEQGLAAEHNGTPLGEAVSLGIHESQSRLWENHVGRSHAFWEWCHPHLARFFGAAVGGFSVDDVFAAANLVQPSFIRVEADEATYDLHVLMRFELETALLRGELAIADLPDAWNARFRELLGIEVPDDARGCLQDVHWSCGLFGYFPTYTLGNLYAAQLMAAARRALPGLDDDLRAGEFGSLRSWLGDHVHRHGKRYSSADLCARATGSALGADPFVTYLGGKLRAVYRVPDA